MKSNGRRLSGDEIDFIKNNVDKSVNYISNALNCSKSTASRWLRKFRGYHYPNVQAKTRDAAKQLWDRKKKRAEQLANDTFYQNCTNSYFLTGLAIYWAEGTKNRVQFTNSDPNMICYFIKCLNNFIPHTKISYEIRGKSSDLERTIVEFWSNYIPLLEYKFSECPSLR